MQGKLTQNGTVESFNSRMRDELYEMLFTGLAHTREAVAAWVDDRNVERRTLRSVTQPRSHTRPDAAVADEGDNKCRSLVATSRVEG